MQPVRFGMKFRIETVSLNGNDISAGDLQQHLPSTHTKKYILDKPLKMEERGGYVFLQGQDPYFLTDEDLAEYKRVYNTFFSGDRQNDRNQEIVTAEFNRLFAPLKRGAKNVQLSMGDSPEKSIRLMRFSPMRNGSQVDITV